MKNDKSPGSDGYTTEVFKFFFSDLGTFMVRTINNGFDKGEISVTQRQVRLLHAYAKKERIEYIFKT